MQGNKKAEAGLKPCCLMLGLTKKFFFGHFQQEWKKRKANNSYAQCLLKTTSSCKHTEAEKRERKRECDT